MNIETYTGYDPDQIYYRHPDMSLTFFFMPETKELIMRPYPEAHWEMLQDEEVFDSVYRTYLMNRTLTRKEKQELQHRTPALIHGDGLAGRLGFDRATPIVAFWDSKKEEVNKANVTAFFEALFKNKPQFAQFINSIVIVLPGGKPILAIDYLGKKADDKPQVKAVKKKVDKKYVIDGQSYKLSDLQNMRADVHSKNVTHPALCSKDLLKYPELMGYRPSTCDDIARPSRLSWQQAARQARVPIYSDSVEFKNWLFMLESK